jgi:nucleoside-diphosphate-sugar epimerase
MSTNPEPLGSTEPSQQQVVVFGGAGYLGSVLTGQLLDHGYQVRVFDSLRFGDEPLGDFLGHPNFRFTEGDIRNINEVTSCLEGAYGVILLASLVGEPACDRDPKETVDINYIASKAVAEACRYHQVPRFIFASTDSAYGIQEGIMYEDSPMNPISLYGRLKLKAEQEILALKDENFKPTVLRMATIYGLSPRMRFDLVVNTLALNAFVHEKITIYGGAQWRPLVHVADAASAYVTCLQAPLDMVGGQVFNVGSNEQNYQIGQLGGLFKEVLPHVELETVPQSPDLRDYHVCFDKISRTLDYRVRHTVADGIQEIYSALKAGRFNDYKNRCYYNATRG